MTASPLNVAKGIWQSPHLDPYQKLAATVVLTAMYDAECNDPEAEAFLAGGGNAPFWFSVITPDDCDLDAVMSLCRRAVRRDRPTDKRKGRRNHD